MRIFAQRCAKELCRDPLNILFGLGFPVALLLLLSAIQANIPVELFAIEQLAPGIAVFGLAFLTLFSATLIARDRETAFLQRLYTTPLKSADFILGYLLPLLPLALAQSAVCYLVALALGLPWTGNILLGILAQLPMAVLYIGLGLLCGSLLNVKQVGGICGALLTNLSGWFSGIWFDPRLAGGWFARISRLLPFAHGVEWERAVLQGRFPLEHLLPVAVYASLCLAAAILVFQKKSR